MIKVPKQRGHYEREFWLTVAHMERMRLFLPKSKGKPRMDDRRVLSGVMYI